MNKLELLNSPLESSLRIIMILNQFKKSAFSIDEIILLDYYVIHLHDFDSSFNSIHPPIPNRENELLIRRELVISGIQILESRSLIKVNYTEYGIKYSTNELANHFTKYMESPYSYKLSKNIDTISANSVDKILKSVEMLIKRDSELWINELE